MSRMLVEAVTLTPGIPHNPKCVLIALAAHARHDGSQARPSQQTIAELMAMSERSVRNGLAWLRQRGYIIAIRRGFEGGNHTVEYQLSLPMLAPRGVPFTVADNPANGAGLQPDNVAPRATLDSAIRQNRHANPATGADNPANIARNPARGAAESGKNQKRESKERESAERALGASASSDSFEKKKDPRNQSPEQALLVPFTDEEIAHWCRDDVCPCETPRDVLWALWEASVNYYVGDDTRTPHRAWLQYVDTFLDSGATTDEIIVGYHLMQNKFEGMEHKPGVKKLAEYWPEWRAKAKLDIARQDAEQKYFEERERQNRLQEEAEQRERQIRAAEAARRETLTPEERAQEDAEIARQIEEDQAAENARHAERMAYMRAKTAPRGEDIAHVS